MWKTPEAKEVVKRLARAGLVIVALSVFSTLIESVAGVGARVRFVDITGVLLERPFWILILGLWAAYVWKRLRVISWSEAIDAILFCAPIALIVPAINVLIAWIGLEASVPAFVNILEAPVSLLTFGWLPRSLASAGTLSLILVGAGVFIGRGWQVKIAPKRLVLAAVIWCVGMMGLLLIPSLIAWVIVSGDASPLNAGPNVLARSWVAFSQEGYWWRSIVERFPGVLEGEAEASVRLLQIVSVWLGGLGVGMVLLRRHATFSLRQLVYRLKPVRGASFFAAAFFGAWIGRLFNGFFFVRAIDLLAWILFLVALGAVWVVQVWRNNLHDAVLDQVHGSESSELAQLDPFMGAWLGWAGLIVAGVSSWLLGWPVFLCLLAFLLLQEVLANPAFRWKARLFGGLVLALGMVFVAAAGIFFALRTAAVPLLPAHIWLSIAVFYFFQALPKAFRWSPRLLGWVATTLHVSPRILIPVVLAVSFLSFPLLSGWIVLWWIAFPCAIVALLPLLGGGRWEERKIVGWQIAFILIAFLLLAVHPSP